MTESTLSHVGYRIGHGHAGKTAAIAEGGIPDAGDGIGGTAVHNRAGDG